MGFFIAFFLLLFSNLLTFISTQKVILQNKKVNQTNRVIHDLDNLLRFIYSAEVAVFTGAPGAGSMRFVNNVSFADSVLNDLTPLLTHNPQQSQNLNELQVLISQKFANLNEMTRTGVNEADAETMFRSDEIETKILTMQSLERTVRAANSRGVLNDAGWIKFLNIISIIIAILLTFFSLVVYNRENRDKKEETKKALEFRRQLESRIEELANLNKELIDLRGLEKYAVTGRIARVIAHEVRNPLTNINLSIEQLRAEMPKDEMAEMFLSMMHRNSVRINQLVSDLLSATRVSDLNFSTESLNDLLDASLEEAADRIGLKQIQVEKNFSTLLKEVYVDAEKIKVVFLNIIVNAIEAMDDGGKLTVETSVESDKFIVKIRDNGAGMAPDQLDKLFEPYFTTKQKGNGLGLANSQNIVLAHNGSIRVESEEGKGSVFTVLLPLPKA